MSNLSNPVYGHAYHLDDGTECDHPSSCLRTIVWPGMNRVTVQD